MSGRRLWTLIRREVLATFRDPFTMAMLVGVPLGALLLFGFILSTDVRNLELGVVDASVSPASRRLVADLEANGTFAIRRYVSKDDLAASLVDGTSSAGLVIPPDFEPRLREARRGGEPAELEAIYDGAEAVLAGNAEAFLGAIVAASVPGAMLRDGLRGGDRTTRDGVEVVARALFNPRLDGKPFMVAGTFGFVLSFLTTIITAVSIVNEKITGTFEQLQVTPATSVEILLGKILPLGAVFALDVVIMVLAAGFVLGVWPAGSILFFVAVSTFYVLISLALGLIFSATSATAAEAVQKTVLFSIPLVQLSGFIFPIRSMPAAVGWIAHLLPATHYIEVSRAIYVRGEGPWTLAPSLLVIALFGVGLVVYALRAIESRG